MLEADFFFFPLGPLGAHFSPDICRISEKSGISEKMKLYFISNDGANVYFFLDTILLMHSNTAWPRIKKLFSLLLGG